jgi:chitodextrinase
MLKNKKTTKNVKVRMMFTALCLSIVASAIVMVLGQQAQQASAAAPANFVYRNGNKLMLNGAPYQFVGYNAFGMFGCEGTPWTRTQMDAYFATLPPASMTRIWASQMYGTSMIDQAVASAAAHNQKLVMTLNNDTGDCVSDGKKNIAWYTSGYKNGTYLAWVKEAVTKYKDSPAVGMWEVINEAGQTYNSQVLDGTMMKNFYETVGSAIKAIDPNHLVSTGDNGDNNYIGGASGVKTASSGADIDVLSLHDYASDYGAAGVISPSFAGLKSAADSLQKPIMIGEINDSACNISKTTRAANVKNSVASYLSNGAAGALIWNRSQIYYNNCSSDPTDDYIVNGTDPLIGIVQNYVIPGVVATPPTTTTPSAGCTVPSNYGVETVKLNVPSTGTYQIWSRIMAADSTNNSYSLDIDGAACVVVGDSGTIPANAWTWVNYKNGSTTTPISLSLTGGDHTLKLVGREQNVKVDRIMALADQACTPTSTGNNCTTTADATPPNVAISAPANGTTVSGTAAVSATATDNIGVTRVEFYVDNSLRSTDTTSPYGYSWDTSALTNGAHSVAVKAYDAAGNVGAATTSVMVANGDTQAPSVPTKVTATANASNKVTLSWTASTDNVAVAGYLVTRGGNLLATVISGTSYTDTTAVPGTAYSYQVTAYDAANNKSAASTAATVTTPQASDTQAPSQPLGLLLTPVSTSQINLSWTASTDNVAVSGYDVYRAAAGVSPAKVATVATPQLSDSGLQADTAYTYYVVAKDASGNASVKSTAVTASTLKQAVTTGTLRGTVQNGRGRAVSGAKVSIWSSDNVQRVATANGNGVYRFDNLPSGIYSMNFHASGYRDAGAQVAVKDGGTVVYDVKLNATNSRPHPWWQWWRR